VIDRIITSTFAAAPADAYHAEIQRAVQRVVVDHLMRLGSSADMHQVRAIVSAKLRARAAALNAAGSSPAAAHGALLAADIKRFLDRPAPPATPTALPTAPPGAPIGEPALEWLRRLEPVCSAEFDR
jgi:hypothetical protein